MGTLSRVSDWERGCGTTDWGWGLADGVWGFIVNGEHYLFEEQGGMNPPHHPADLVWEAAEIAERGEWHALASHLQHGVTYLNADSDKPAYDFEDDTKYASEEQTQLVGNVHPHGRALTSKFASRHLRNGYLVPFRELVEVCRPGHVPAPDEERRAHEHTPSKVYRSSPSFLACGEHKVLATFTDRVAAPYYEFPKGHRYGGDVGWRFFEHAVVADFDRREMVVASGHYERSSKKDGWPSEWRNLRTVHLDDTDTLRATAQIMRRRFIDAPETVDGVPPFCSTPSPGLSERLAHCRWGGETREVGAPPPDSPGQWERAMQHLAANGPPVYAATSSESLREQARAEKRRGQLSNRQIAMSIGLTADSKDVSKVQRWTSDLPNAPRKKR